MQSLCSHIISNETYDSADNELVYQFEYISVNFVIVQGATAKQNVAVLKRNLD